MTKPIKYYEYKATTFNGNTVIGKGETQERAVSTLHDAAADVGSCVKKVITKNCMVLGISGKYFRTPI